MIRVLIADDQALVRGGFRVLLETADDITVVGEAENGVEAVSKAATLSPDVILMDIRMPQLDGIEATRQICGSPSSAGTRVLILTTFDLDEYVFESLRAGASGFMLKDIEPQYLLEAVRIIDSGESLLAPSVTRKLISEFISRPVTQRTAGVLDVLTERELEVLTLVARGLSNQEIATELFISPTTAKTHVSHIMGKVQARDRAQLVVMAFEGGLAR